MAAQTLREAWLPILNKSGLYPDAETVKSIESELYKFFGQEVLKVAIPAAQELREATAIELFESVFKRPFIYY